MFVYISVIKTLVTIDEGAILSKLIFKVLVGESKLYLEVSAFSELIQTLSSTNDASYGSKSIRIHSIRIVLYYYCISKQTLSQTILSAVLVIFKQSIIVTTKASVVICLP